MLDLRQPNQQMMTQLQLLRFLLGPQVRDLRTGQLYACKTVIKDSMTTQIEVDNVRREIEVGGRVMW
jgi:hypothetical protein